MASWKKIILSGSRAELAAVTASLAAPFLLPNISTNAETNVLTINSDGTVAKSSYTVLTSTDVGTIASQDANNVNITGGTIGSNVTISKSPSVTITGDMAYSATLTNLGNASAAGTLNPAAITGKTATTDNLQNNDDFLIYDNSVTALRKLSYGILTASLKNSGFIDVAGGDGDVVGPASSTDNAIARFDATTGKLLQNSAVIIDDSNNITGVNNLTLNGDLTVNGSTSTLNVTNVNIEDKFILIASGSVGGSDGGIIVQTGSLGSGKALTWDNSLALWGIQNSISWNATTTTQVARLATVEVSTGNPSTPPAHGGTGGDGQLYVNSSNGEVWIYA